MEGRIQRVSSAIIDGRAQTPRYIQKQLAKLYYALQKEKRAIHDAICQDSFYTPSEADAEIFLAIKAVKEQYEAFNFEKFIDQEYSLANGKDNACKRVPIGCVYIIPCQHSQFYSIIQPACVSIATGNCVVIELRDTLSILGSLLRKIFRQSMDKDTFLVVESQPATDDFFSGHCTIVDGRNEPSESLSSRVLCSPSSRSIAIVDRTSMISNTARDIVRARFAFCGRSPYAPDLVLVNEFVFDEFCVSAARYATEHFGSNLQGVIIRKDKLETTSNLQKELQISGARSLISGSNQCIAIVDERKSHLLSQKVTEPVLLVHRIRSLDDGIDLANSGSPLQAAYLFGSFPSAKYLSQFIQTRISFTNHIPVDLLVGPTAPIGFATSVPARYTKEMFSVPSPEYITASPQNIILTQMLDLHGKEALSKTKAEMSAPLVPTSEPAGKAVGFFEQGLLTGGVVVIVSALTATVLIVRYVVPTALVWLT